MTREIEYRAYWKSKGEIRDVVDIYFGKKQEVQSVRVLCEHDGMSYLSDDIYVDDFILMQYTGIKDKNGVKIYEFMEIDNKFVVAFECSRYILINIFTRDIIDFYSYIKDRNNEIEITKEYSEIQRDS